MNNKLSAWGPGDYRLQVYLPDDIKAALDRYAKDKFPGGSRVTSAIVRNALTEYLEKAGYLDIQGGENEVKQ